MPKVVEDLLELGGDAPALLGDLAQPPLDFGCRHRSVCCQVEQVLFLDVERLQLRGELFTVQSSCCRGVGEQFFHDRAQSFDEIWTEVDGLVMFLDRGFNKVFVVVGRVAGVVLGAGAEEVVI
ncbi:hypothetical protein [Gordonia sp. N1V]|uniref:hypothetical protein n=1 Tax=Gordonia sp. N1V TaxID=3034163 RepID=UPI0023E21079|nr:hypothetical protein [Gordonia sp. N1V]MDF3284952.1 hypothetical protein [Gordonia sp. N1V]